MSTWTDRARLYIRGRAFLLDLGEEVAFYTESGPKRARYLLVGKLSLPERLRLGLPREGVLHYPLAVDPLASSPSTPPPHQVQEEWSPKKSGHHPHGKLRRPGKGAGQEVRQR